MFPLAKNFVSLGSRAHFSLRACVCERERVFNHPHAMKHHFISRFIPFICLVLCLFVYLLVSWLVGLFDQMSFPKIPFNGRIHSVFHSTSIIVLVIVRIQFFSTLVWIMNPRKLVKYPWLSSKNAMDDWPTHRYTRSPHQRFLCGCLSTWVYIWRCFFESRNDSVYYLLRACWERACYHNLKALLICERAASL